MKYFFEYAATRPRNENNISASHYILYINVLFSLKNIYNVYHMINDMKKPTNLESKCFSDANPYLVIVFPVRQVTQQNRNIRHWYYVM